MKSVTRLYGNSIANKLNREIKIISPEGEIYKINSIREFCKNHPKLNDRPEITNVGIARVIAGTRKQYKGWKIYNGGIA